ncbi:MAG TPA: hypothetical protein VEU08_01925, partial [Vicinamibacterales bacterium]|nr:hypothetical protein [Vicinamibacterales bacterium]
ELLVVTTGGAAVRVPIPYTSGPRDAEVTLGDISIADPIRVVVRLLEPIQLQPCDIIAIGPIARLGMSVVRAASLMNVYTLELPEPGQWSFSADCGGQSRTLVPIVATIPAGVNATLSTVDLRFAQ